MYKVYKITNKLSGKYYIGMTKQSLKKRFSQHKTNSKNGGKTYLSNALRKHGVENFEIEQLFEFENRADCCAKEIECISDNLNGYNLSKGGDTGFNMLEKSDKEIAAWRSALSKSRQNKQPALGMKHSDENKELFSKVSKEYWETQETYKWDDIKSYTYKEAKILFGISTTHYYRLKKQNGEQALSRSEAAKAGWNIKLNEQFRSNDPR